MLAQNLHGRFDIEATPVHQAANQLNAHLAQQDQVRQEQHNLAAQQQQVTQAQLQVQAQQVQIAQDLRTAMQNDICRTHGCSEFKVSGEGG